MNKKKYVIKFANGSKLELKIIKRDKHVKGISVLGKYPKVDKGQNYERYVKQFYAEFNAWMKEKKIKLIPPGTKTKIVKTKN